MALPRTSLRSFLSHARSTLHSAIDRSQPVNLVIGNESADLDSLTSSILYAYLRSYAPLLPSSRRPTNPSTAQQLHIPLLNVPAADISIRPEFLTLLPYANLSESHLLTLDDLPPGPSSRLSPENTRWILTDHNVLQPPLATLYGSRVVGVIDHHEEETSAIPQSVEEGEPRIIEKCGSCTSLVTLHFRAAWDQLSAAAVSSGGAHGQSDTNEGIIDDGPYVKTWDAQLAYFALGAILVDTSNLTSIPKTTPKDREAVSYLESKILASSTHAAQYDRKAFFRQLNKAKKDIDRLSVPDVLRKDYKQWVEGPHSYRIGISSVVRPLEWLIRKADSSSASSEETSSSSSTPFLAHLLTHARHRSLSVASIMTTFTDPSTDRSARELFLWALDPSASEHLRMFVERNGEDLGLEGWGKGVLDSDGNGDGEGEGEGEEKTGVRMVFRQRDTTKSRKQVAPLLRRALAGDGGDG
ncbi:MAG: Exopolyphosphatase [Caeruleum heppii]|nr:MAG: Exopolyphosphatase [Caeruleum heppii]